MDEELSSNRRAADIALINKHVVALGEHFDTVHIFASRHIPGDENGTAIFNRGSGNWCARVGHIKEFIIYEDERIRQCAQPKSED